MKKELMRETQFSSPVYVGRYYSSSGETARNFKEHEGIARWRGECRDRREDDINSWLDKNAVCTKNGGQLDGQYLFMGEGILCEVHHGVKHPPYIPQRRCDYICIRHITIRSQPASRELPTELVEALKERGYEDGHISIDSKKISLPASVA